MKRNPKITALNRFKKANRRKTMFLGRWRLAYYVPGTRENGTYQMLLAQLRPIDCVGRDFMSATGIELRTARKDVERLAQERERIAWEIIKLRNRDREIASEIVSLNARIIAILERKEQPK